MERLDWGDQSVPFLHPERVAGVLYILDLHTWGYEVVKVAVFL